MAGWRDALKTLIDGEREAVVRYSSWAATAQSEGFAGVATLFSALAAAEKIHIRNHLSALKEPYPERDLPPPVTASTRENLAAAIAGEREENRRLYPPLLKACRAEKQELACKVAALSMEWAMKVEKEHGRLLDRALAALTRGEDFQLRRILLCTVCGNLIVESLKEKECPICGHDALFFERIDQ